MPDRVYLSAKGKNAWQWPEMREKRNKLNWEAPIWKLSRRQIMVGGGGKSQNINFSSEEEERVKGKSCFLSFPSSWGQFFESGNHISRWQAQCADKCTKGDLSWLLRDRVATTTTTLLDGRGFFTSFTLLSCKKYFSVARNLFFRRSRSSFVQQANWLRWQSVDKFLLLSRFTTFFSFLSEGET